MMVILIAVGALGTTSPSKDLIRGLEELEIGDHSNYSTEKNPENLQRFSVTKIPVKDNQ